MKKIYLIFLSCMVTSCCSYVEDNLLSDVESTEKTCETDKFQVSFKSAEYFANKVQFDSNIDSKIEDIDFIAYGKDTLLYFVNYKDNKGWVVLSGDKRTEAILASSCIGKIDKNKLGGTFTWFNDIADRIYELKHSNNKDTISNDYAMWCKIDTLTFGLQKYSNSSTRSLRSRRLSPPEYDGDYEDILIDTKIDVISDKHIGPLIATQWGQDFPWNECLPFWQNTTQKCVTGCVAVAGAQLLYYFHYFQNKPAAFYSQGQCDGIVYDSKNYDIHYDFSNPSDSVWDEMELFNWDYEYTKGTKLVSTLMAYVDRSVNMNYGRPTSSANTRDLVNLYHEFGINSEYSTYDPALVRSSLDKLIPINIRAYCERKRKKILFFNNGWSYSGGHSWIIDGYKEKKTCYTYTYLRKYKVKPSDPEAPSPVRSVSVVNEPIESLSSTTQNTYTRSATSTSYYWKMNFGWNGTGDDGDYFTEEGSVWTAGGYNFQYEKNIIHNFSF